MARRGVILKNLIVKKQDQSLWLSFETDKET